MTQPPFAQNFKRRTYRQPCCGSSDFASAFGNSRQFPVRLKQFPVKRK